MKRNTFDKVRQIQLILECSRAAGESLAGPSSARGACLHQGDPGRGVLGCATGEREKYALLNHSAPILQTCFTIHTHKLNLLHDTHKLALECAQGLSLNNCTHFANALYNAHKSSHTPHTRRKGAKRANIKGIEGILLQAHIHSTL